MKNVTITVNGEAVKAHLEPRQTLADFLRENRRLTGTHLGCEQGVCGSCTVLLANEPVRACLVFAVSCDGQHVQSIEGFENDPVMTALRTAFKEEHALQCGFCTTGMLITARDIVLRATDDDEKRVRTELSGNLCRCTGYVGIVSAVRRVIRERLARERA